MWRARAAEAFVKNYLDAGALVAHLKTRPANLLEEIARGSVAARSKILPRQQNASASPPPGCTRMMTAGDGGMGSTLASTIMTRTWSLLRSGTSGTVAQHDSTITLRIAKA